jgi:hypothetical protein
MDAVTNDNKAILFRQSIDSNHIYGTLSQAEGAPSKETGRPLSTMESAALIRGRIRGRRT